MPYPCYTINYITMNMKKVLLISTLLIAFMGTSHGQFGKLVNKAKKSAESLKEKATGQSGALDIAGGLKEALNEGVDEAVNNLSAKDGFLKSSYKILIPKEAAKVVSKLKMVPGFGDVEDQLISKMNEAAEIATKEATPIFVSAIKGMTIKDAKAILFGDGDAATRYLEGSARQKLYSSFLPIIQSALNEVNATKYWNDIVKKYNSLPLTRDLNPDLDDHVNNKALDGLFGLIEVKEEGIRNDVNQRTSPLLRDVFKELD